MSYCCLAPDEQFSSYIILRTRTTFWSDDEDICFVLHQYANAYFIVFHLNRLDTEPATCHIRGEEANHYTIEVVILTLIHIYILSLSWYNNWSIADLVFNNNQSLGSVCSFLWILMFSQAIKLTWSHIIITGI